MRLFRTGARGNVLILLCLMYFITYIDRVNVSSAAAAFKSELGLSNTQLGLVFSAFAYPYLVFQIIGGWFGDKFGARWTLTICGVVWAAATVLTGLAATFPVATRAMSAWLPESKLGFGQGITHACARICNAITPPLVVALIALVSWRGSFVLLGVASFFWVQSLVRRADQRRMLFDLDASIQAAAAKLGDDPTVVELTGHYHNLLRLWAEV